MFEHTIFDPRIFVKDGEIRAKRPQDAESDPAAGDIMYDQRAFKIRLADNLGQRNAAHMLIQKMYGWRGYHVDSSPTLKPVHPHHIVLVASDEAGTLGTITLTLDSEHGLVADQVFSAEINKVRRDAGYVCEMGKLAVDSNRGSKWVLASLFHIAYMYCRLLNGVTDIFIEVNPRHVNFYKRMLGFTRASEERACPRVGAPAVLMRLNLNHADEQIALYGGKAEMGETERSLYPYFFSRREQDGLLHRIAGGEDIAGKSATLRFKSGAATQ